MVRATTAQLLRWLLVGCGAAALLVAVVGGLGRVVTSAQVSVLLPFAALAVAGALLAPALPLVDRLVARVTRHERVSPYTALADATRRIQAGTPDEVLPGLARVLAVGTGARAAAVWLAVEDRLVEAARHPSRTTGAAGSAPGLGALLARPDTDHVVPVLDEAEVRAALTLTKPGPVTAADRRLMRDLASGAGLLLRVAALNAELAQQVGRAADLAGELQASRRRLADARDAERRRLVGELAHATGEPLAALHELLADARADLDATDGAAGGAPVGGAAARALATARTRLDDLLDRFRLIARGVYPSVLRDQGLVSALDEVTADLPRRVEVDGSPGPRMSWEIESGAYFAVASVLRELAARPGGPPLTVRLHRAGGRIEVDVEDAHPPVDGGELRTRLSDDADRLGALGGVLEVDVTASSADETALGPGTRPIAVDAGPLAVRLWLPDRLEPVVSAAGAQAALR